MTAAASNVRPEFDRLFVDIAEYSCRDEIVDSEAFGAARWCLMDIAHRKKWGKVVKMSGARVD